MALFVAKLFDSAGGSGNKVSVLDQRDDTVDVSSPASHSQHRRQEPFSTTLARTLRRAHREPLKQHTELTDEFKAALSQVLLDHAIRNEDETVAHRWPADKVEILQSIPISETADPEIILNESIRFLRNLIETEKERRSVAIESERRKSDMLISKLVGIYELGPSIHSAFSAICDKVSVIENTVKSEHTSIRKAKFLESVNECLMITDSLKEYLESATIDVNTEAFVDQLALAAGMAESLIGRSREVIHSRILILTKSIVERLISELKNGKADQSMDCRVRLFMMLTRFEHQDPLRALSIFFEPKLRKFEYHFVRKASQLNLVDKPEWPLRWLLDLAAETAKCLPVEHHLAVGCFLARRAREYFNAHRWGLLDNPRSAGQSDHFSLYLARYIHITSQWTEVFGPDILNELWLDLREGAHMGSGKWTLLEEWVVHDKKHIERAVESTKQPFKPSPYNSEVCSIVQMIEDVLGASRVRISSIASFGDILVRFREDCHDPTLEDFMYKVRVTGRDGFVASESNMIKKSIERLHRFLVESDLCSPYIRRQLLDVSKFI